MTAHCNCLFEGEEQVMWCPLHLKLRDEIEILEAECLRVAKEMDEQCRTNVALRNELKSKEEGLLEIGKGMLASSKRIMELETLCLSKNALLEEAWGLIANANEGFWERATPMWRTAANQWRDKWLKR